MSVSMLSEQLVKAGQKVEVFTTTANGVAELPVTAGELKIVEGVEVTYFKRITKDHTHFSPQLLKNVWKSARKFDVVHIHGWWNTVSVLSCLIAGMQKVPVVISPRGMLSSYSFTNKNDGVKGIIHRLLGKSLLKKSFVHTTSQNEYLAVQRIVEPKAIFNIPNFIKLPAKIEPVTPGPANRLNLIFFSRIEEKKGLDLLLSALQLVTVPYHLTIAGDGDALYVASLKKQAEDARLNKSVSWIGFQNEHKFDVLAGHDVLVLPSYDENFGNVVIESLSVGTAVLISDQVGLAGYVEKNKLGWICKTQARSVGELINDIYNRKNELKNIRNIAPLKVRQDFEASNLVKNYVDMYTQILIK